MKNLGKYIILVVLLVMVALQFTVIHSENQMKQFKEVDVVIEKSSENFIEVKTAKELVEALKNSKIKIIDIKNDLDLGYNILMQQGIEGKEIITKHNEPKTHPKLMQSGVSKLNIKEKDGLILTSTNGSKLLHTNIVIENSKNIKIDNLTMEELWEWDEESEGEYDIQDWDYITVKKSENICISNCEFSKAYDGITDIKGSKNVTIKNCKLNEIDIENLFYEEQFNYLQNNKEQFQIYKFLKEDILLSYNEIKELSAYQFKGYTIDSLDGIKCQNIIIHDCIFLNLKTRMPRIREGTAFIYNVYVDSRKINGIKENLQKNKKYKNIKEKYKKIVDLDPYGIISTKDAFVVAKNTVFEGAIFQYYSRREERRKWYNCK